MTQPVQTESTISRHRIEGLSDLIFGLALTIGAIPLVGNPPHTASVFITSVSAFAFSFLIVITIWYRYTVIVSNVPVDTPVMIRLNMMLLLLVAIEPYLFNLLVVNSSAVSQVEPDASAFFALDIAGMNFIIAYFAYVSSSEERGRISGIRFPTFNRMRDPDIITTILFAVSAIPAFWTITAFGIRLRFLLWIFSIPMAVVFRLYWIRLDHR